MSDVNEGTSFDHFKRFILCLQVDRELDAVTVRVTQTHRVSHTHCYREQISATRYHGKPGPREVGVKFVGLRSIGVFLSKEN